MLLLSFAQFLAVLSLASKLKEALIYGQINQKGAWPSVIWWAKTTEEFHTAILLDYKVLRNVELS